MRAGPSFSVPGTSWTGVPSPRKATGPSAAAENVVVVPVEESQSRVASGRSLSVSKKRFASVTAPMRSRRPSRSKASEAAPNSLNSLTTRAS